MSAQASIVQLEFSSLLLKRVGHHGIHDTAASRDDSWRLALVVVRM